MKLNRRSMAACPSNTRRNTGRPRSGANVAGDDDTNARLREAGWTVLRFWEHQEADVVAQAIIDVIMADRGRT